MVTQKDLVKSLESVYKDVYYNNLFRDLDILLKGTNCYATKNIPDLEKNFKYQQSIFNSAHSCTLEQWKELYKYLKSENCKVSYFKIFSQLLDSLNHLIEGYNNVTKFPSSEAKVELVLDIIFEIGIKCKNFTVEEKREIAELMVHCLQPINTYIETISNLYRTRLDCYVLQRRSALQFLVENYTQFPVKDAILLNGLEKSNIKESIEILDDIIQNYRDVSDSSDCESDYESAGVSRMPHSHSWWCK